MTKQKIAVLGGGVGALSAVFYITEQPGWADKYDITVYQQGWRLGGKCASGHDMRPGYGYRIYEHGLHIFAGFYDQSFDLLRRAYDVIARPDHHPNQTVWDSFSPEDTITLVDHSEPTMPNLEWFLNMAPNDDTPGEDLTVAPMIVMIQRMVGILVQGAPVPIEASKASTAEGASIAGDAISWVGNFIHKSVEELEELATDFFLSQLIKALEEHVRLLKGQNWGPATEILAERFLLAVYLVQSVVQGIASDNLLKMGYDSIDKYEFSEWIYNNALIVAKREGSFWGDPATRATQLIDWTPISSMYDYVFGFGDGGDVNKRSFAAGTALRSAMLMISYKGHFFWKMRGAMGDVVIAPIYMALLKRGVKFQFFSRVTALNIDPDTDRIASVDYVQQSGMKGQATPYQPLVEIPIPGWPADLPLEGWPAAPLWDQLADGAALQSAGRDFEADHLDAPGAGDLACQLKLGSDFDKVILGISVGGLKQVCRSFPARLPKSNWGPMFGAVTVTRTCAMQLWLTRTVDDLGCKGSRRTLAGADQPYSSWSDMSHLLSRETWDGSYRPRSILYFCGQIQGPENGPPADKKAYDLALSWLTGSTKIFWDRATAANSPYGMDPALIYDPDPKAGGDVLMRQYIRANTSPSDLYVQSPKNSVYTRMDANQSGLSNLFLTGDWTLNGINSGCAEAAARSGARCASAVAGTLKPLD